jgi:hypothetical protein
MLLLPSNATTTAATTTAAAVVNHHLHCCPLAIASALSIAKERGSSSTSSSMPLAAPT